MSKIKQIFEKYNKVHIVGLSPKPDRASNKIAHYLSKQGYEVFGVHPKFNDIDGFPTYPSINEVPEDIEILDIFRANEHLPKIVDEAIAKSVKVLWLQLGVHDEASEKRAEEAGIIVVSNQCILIEHQNELS